MDQLNRDDLWHAWELLESARINLDNLATTFPVVRLNPLFKIVEMQLGKGTDEIGGLLGLKEMKP